MPELQLRNIFFLIGAALLPVAVAAQEPPAASGAWSTAAKARFSQDLQTDSKFDIPSNPAAAVLPKPFVAVDPQREYSLPDLIDIAERENRETRVAWEIAKNAALATGIAESTYLPRVTANIIGGFHGSTGNDSALGFTADESGTAYGSVSSATLEWLLFDFGGRTNVVRAARRLATASNIAFKGTHQKVIHDVCMAYYTYLAARRHVDTARTSLASARDIQAATEDRYVNGVGTVVETTQTRQVTAQAQLASIQAGGAERTAYASLLAAIGLSPLDSIKIAPLTERTISPDSLQPIDVLVRDALAKRADVLTAYTAEQASHSAVKAAEALNRPKIFLAGTGAYIGGQLGLTAIPPVGGQLPTLNISGGHWNATVLVGVNFTVFDGKARAHAVQQARNNSTQAAANLDRIRIAAVGEIVAAKDALETNIAAHEAAVVLLEAALTSYDAAVESYKNDVGTVTAAVAAQTQLAQARQAVDDAYNATLASAATLAFASGSLTAAPQ